MYQLNYRSMAIPGLELKNLENILETAIAVNSAHNISGCHIHHKDSFVQVLEGRKKDVIKIFESIITDERHHTVTVLWENDVDHRFFSEWNMAFYRPDDKNLQQYVNNLLLLAELSDKSSGSLLSFWATVRKILRGDTISQYEKVY